MLRFKDSAASVSGPKTARMEQRTKPEIKERIRMAAALLGVDETTFVTSAALDRAQATLADHERSLLAAADRELVLAALLSPEAPTEELRSAFDLHRARIPRGR